MFNIKKLTKYSVVAFALASVIFIAVPNSAKAEDYYSEDTYSSYYPETTYSNSSYYPETTYSNSYYSEPSISYSYSDPVYSYSSPSYYQSDYSLVSGYCSSCYSGGYNYAPSHQIAYTPPAPVYVAPYVPPQQNLNASCVINPSNVNVNDTVTISASASGGNGSYSYYWSGSDGIYGSSQVITSRFTSVGSKMATLTVTSGSQSVTRSCNAYVNQNYNYNYNNYNNNYANVTATCVATPVNANVGDNVVWTVYPTGGNGSYTYSWTGSDSLNYGNANQIQQRYTTPGNKTATVTVYSSNGQSTVSTCSTNIGGSVIQGTPISGIYLNEVPATGIDFNFKVALYIIGMILWSAFVGFVIIERKKGKLAMANRGRIEDFKQENLRKKGLL